MDRVSYSIAAVLIFLSGIYFGVRYLPAVQEDSYSIRYNKDPLIKKDRNLLKEAPLLHFLNRKIFSLLPNFVNKQLFLLVAKTI